MDTQDEYNVGKSIVQSIAADEWDLLRSRKGAWSNDKEHWKQYINYSIEELKELMKEYKKSLNMNINMLRVLQRIDGILVKLL